MELKHIRTFLPAKDYEESKSFYKELGFELQYENDELCILGVEKINFFLQKYYQKEWAENMMLQLFVDDIDEWFGICKTVCSKYSATKINEVFTADYGRTFHLIGPAGELWHMTEI